MSADRYLRLLCADCGDERQFEQPPCDDGHGADCPEWACVECGAAILLGAAPLPEKAPAETSGGQSSPAQSRSAARLDEARRRGDVQHRYVA